MTTWKYNNRPHAASKHNNLKLIVTSFLQDFRVWIRFWVPHVSKYVHMLLDASLVSGFGSRTQALKTEQFSRVFGKDWSQKVSDKRIQNLSLNFQSCLCILFSLSQSLKEHILRSKQKSKWFYKEDFDNFYIQTFGSNLI